MPRAGEAVWAPMLGKWPWSVPESIRMWRAAGTQSKKTHCPRVALVVGDGAWLKLDKTNYLRRSASSSAADTGRPSEPGAIAGIHGSIPAVVATWLEACCIAPAVGQLRPRTMSRWWELGRSRGGKMHETRRSFIDIGMLHREQVDVCDV